MASADFDQSYQPINAGYPGQTAAAYTVQSGDTLQSIAQATWGDASLWYLIADANGLTAATSLATGQILSIPNKVANVHNSSATFRVYNPGEAIGDTLPTLPAEPQPPPPPQASHGCGPIGAILVAIAVQFSPGVNAAFDSAFGTLFAGGVPATVGSAAEIAGNIVGTAVLAAAGDALGQGVALAVGAQKSFNWSEVALSGISAGVARGVGPALSGVDAVVGKVAGNFGVSVVKGAIGGAVS